MRKGAKMDEHVEVTHRNYFQRLGDSLKGFFFGLLFLVGSTYALYWNETRVDLSELVKESVNLNKQSASDGEFISYSGLVDSNQSLSDGIYLKPITHIVALSKEVQMYAWEEEEHSHTEEHADGSSTTTKTYTYKKVWTSSPQSSAHFKKSHGHHNPSPVVPTGYDIFKASDITIDNYALFSESLSISPYKELLLSPQKLLKGALDFNASRDSIIKKIEQNYIFMGKGSLHSPIIGDTRISYRYFPTNVKVTTFGVLSAQSIEPYVLDEDADFIAKSSGVYRLFLGSRAMAIKKLAMEESILNWGIRIIALIFLFVSINMLFAPLNALFNVLYISQVTRAITGTVSFILTAVIATIAIIFGKLASYVGFLGVVLAVIIAVFVSLRVLRKPQKS